MKCPNCKKELEINVDIKIEDIDDSRVDVLVECDDECGYAGFWVLKTDNILER